MKLPGAKSEREWYAYLQRRACELEHWKRFGRGPAWWRRWVADRLIARLAKMERGIRDVCDEARAQGGTASLPLERRSTSDRSRRPR